MHLDFFRGIPLAILLMSIAHTPAHARANLVSGAYRVTVTSHCASAPYLNGVTPAFTATPALNGTTQINSSVPVSTSTTTEHLLMKIDLRAGLMTAANGTSTRMAPQGSTGAIVVATKDTSLTATVKYDRETDTLVRSNRRREATQYNGTIGVLVDPGEHRYFSVDGWKTFRSLPNTDPGIFEQSYLTTTGTVRYSVVCISSTSGERIFK
jgi:hypothetical protein